jgi:LEA14-like dessication related protein
MASLLSLIPSFLKPKGIDFVEAKDPVFGKLNNGIIPFKITLRLRNPNIISATLQSLILDLSCIETKIGEANQAFQKEIPANEVFELTINLNLIAAGIKEILKDDFLDILTEGKVKVPLQIKGNVGVKKMGLNFNVPVNFTKEFEFILDDLLAKIKL